jgi:hypothetical protein
LLYGAEVWGYEKNDISETLHLEFCKYIMKVKKCTPNYIVYGELGRVPITATIYQLVKTMFLLFLTHRTWLF